MSTIPTLFSVTGEVQYHVVPATGCYVIEAAGAQGGAGGGPGGKGARIMGTFQLVEGDVLQIVVGQQGKAGTSLNQAADGGHGGAFVWKGPGNRLLPCAGGGGGGGTFVWKFDRTRLYPAQPLLVAGGGGGGNGGGGVVTRDATSGAAPGGRNGHGGETDQQKFHYSGGGGAGWLSNGAKGSAPTYCAGGAHWRGGAGSSYCGHQGGSGGYGGGGGGSFFGCGSGGGGGYSGGSGGTHDGPGGGGGSSFNAGRNQINVPGIQTGDGYVSIAVEPVFTMVQEVDDRRTSAVPMPVKDTLDRDCGDADLARALRPRAASRSPFARILPG